MTSDRPSATLAEACERYWRDVVVHHRAAGREALEQGDIIEAMAHDAFAEMCAWELKGMMRDFLAYSQSIIDNAKG